MKAYLYLTMLVVAATIAVLWGKGCFKTKVPAPVVQHVSTYDSAKHYRDMYNTVHAQAELEISDRRSLIDAHRLQIDSLMGRLHLRENQLKDMSEVIAQSSGSFIAPLQTVIIHDTVDGQPRERPAQTFDWHDDYLAEWGTIFSDRIEVEYKMDLSITTTSFWRRKHKFLGIRFGKKIYYLDAFCNNPNVSITGLKGLQINN